MLKRHDSFLSSSSRRENATPLLPPSKPTPAKKPVGCMSGIFRIFSKFQLHRRRKFLTFGENKQANIHAKPSEATFVVSVSPKSDNSNKSSVDIEKDYLGELSGGGFSCEIPRSPSTLIAPETRRTKSQDFAITSSALHPPAAARENADMRPEMIMSTSSSGAERRRKLLDALDKCDLDLKALKKIIESVQLEEDQADQYNCPASTKNTSAWLWGDLVTTPSAAAAMKRSTRATEQDFKLSSLSNTNNSIYSRRHSITTTTTTTTMNTTASTGRMMTQQHKLSARKKQEHYDMEEASFMKKFREVILLNSSRYKPKSSSSSWSSKAMMESVDEVCGDIYWGEKREIRQLGLELQAFICRDLIEEIVKDFGYFSSNIHNYSSLPFQACRRKLQF